MVMTSNLSAETRKSVGKGNSRALRREGKIPAIVYGNKKKPSFLISAFKSLSFIEIAIGSFLLP